MAGELVPRKITREQLERIIQRAAERGEGLSQRALARQLRQHGHRFPNEHLRQIAASAGLATWRAA